MTATPALAAPPTALESERAGSQATISAITSKDPLPHSPGAFAIDGPGHAQGELEGNSLVCAQQGSGVAGDKAASAAAKPCSS